MARGSGRDRPKALIVFGGHLVDEVEFLGQVQRCGLFRTEYVGTMLREHYGLPWPKSVFDDPAWAGGPLEAVAGV